MKKRLIIGAVLQLLILLSVAGFAYFSAQQYAGHVEWLVHIREVSAEIDRIEVQILEKQSFIRGYRASGDRFYLDHYDPKPVNLERLQSLVRDTEAKKLVAQLVPVMEKKNHLLDDSYIIALDGIVNNDTQLENMKQGTFLTAQVEELLDALRAREDVLLTERTKTMETANTRLNYAGLALTLVGFSFVGFYAFSSFRDFTHIEKLKDEVESTNKELEQFVYIASHDLQEPLRTISSYLQLVERRYKDVLEEDGKEFIAFAIEGSGRMKKLINDLLNYSRSGRMTDLETFKVRDVLSEVLGVLELEDCDVRIRRMPKITAYRTGIYQIFQNLISNSVKFKKAECVISVECTELKNHWRFCVRDNGIGIPKDLQHKLFKPFVKLNSDKPGSGIGLAVVKKIVESHEGEVWVDSDEGKGAAFYFTIKKEL
jgi:signal transduction histidine kinase